MAHGSKHFDIIAPRSSFYQGPFGRICPDLPGWSPPGVPEVKLDDFFTEIAVKHMIEVPGKKPSDLIGDENNLDTKFGSNIPAGYTYFGQFIDHDITFDPASSLMRRNDPSGLLNFRTPRLDLDNVYGAGPADQPYLYEQSGEHKGIKLAIGEIAGTGLPDLPRFHDIALIGDMRNDENSIVSQLQLAFLLAHNELVDRAKAAGIPVEERLEAARKTLRWLYQHIVWNDFLRRVTEPAIHKCALALESACGGRRRWVCGLDDVYRWKHQPFMPVEFSVAAYRFGHSMVRNAYQTNNPVRGFGNFAPIFDKTGTAPTPPGPDDLRGFRPMDSRNAIQWDWFLPMTSSSGPFPQMARKIDTKLANALAFLHEGPAGYPLNVLAFRNLKRGWTFQLPSGTAMANKFCLKPVPLKKHEPDALWYYILRESEIGGGNHLGAVGSIIVCAVFAGLLKGDSNSWFSQQPCWRPDNDPLLKPGTDNVDDRSWTLASIIRIAGIKADGIGFAP